MYVSWSVSGRGVSLCGGWALFVGGVSVSVSGGMLCKGKWGRGCMLILQSPTLSAFDIVITPQCF